MRSSEQKRVRCKQNKKLSSSSCMIKQIKTIKLTMLNTSTRHEKREWMEWGIYFHDFGERLLWFILKRILPSTAHINHKTFYVHKQSSLSFLSQKSFSTIIIICLKLRVDSTFGEMCVCVWEKSFFSVIVSLCLSHLNC